MGGLAQAQPVDGATKSGQMEVAEPLREHTAKPPELSDHERPFEALVEELVSLSQEAFSWGVQRGFPAEYPQDARAKQLGQLIYTLRGFEGMQEASRILRRRVVTRDGGGQCFLITYNWEGIGPWRP